MCIQAGHEVAGGEGQVRLGETWGTRETGVYQGGQGRPGRPVESRDARGYHNYIGQNGNKNGKIGYILPKNGSNDLKI